MSQPTESPASTQELQAEVQHLHARLAALEVELLEAQAHANDAVAEWQERAYWLDRWHLDLNELMRRRGTAELRALLRAVRSVARIFRRAKRSVRS
jgi:tetrahydrodipicolinate N-succinyltransferase